MLKVVLRAHERNEIRAYDEEINETIDEFLKYCKKRLVSLVAKIN